MLRKLVLGGLLAYSLLYAQVVPDAALKFNASVDDALGVRPGAVIADIGTGNAVAHPLLIAEKVGPGGKVICIDVMATAVASLNKRFAESHAGNIEARLGKEDDPLLPPGTCDAILVSNAYHHFTQAPAMLKHLRDALKPGGRLVVVEFFSNGRLDGTRSEQVKNHEMSPAILEREFEPSLAWACTGPSAPPQWHRSYPILPAPLRGHGTAF